MPAPPTPSPTPTVRFPLRYKLALAGAVLALVPLLVLGGLLIDINADALQTQARAYQLAVADDLARTVNAEFTSVQDGLDAVGRALFDPDASPDLAVQLGTTLLSASEQLDLAAVYAPDGQLIDVLREPRTRALQVPEQLSEQDRVQAGRQHVDTGHARRTPLGPRLWLVVPTLDADGQARGYVGTLLSLSAIQDRVERLSELRFQGRDDALYVVDGDARILAHPNPELAHALSIALYPPMLRALSAESFSGRLQHVSEYVGPDGEAMVGSLVPIPGRGLAVALQVPRRQAYASLYSMRRTVVLSVLLVAALVLLLTYVGARRLTIPLAKLTGYARRLAGRQFDAQVDVGTRDELSVLASAMRSAAVDLKAGEARLRDEVAIRTDLGRYLPAELVERVVKREQDMALGGSRRAVSVLFADVVAFTPLTEQLQAEGTVQLLNELFTVLTEIVFRHGGTVDKFIGDCVMALWGAPEDDPRHAAHAIAAAEDMLSWLESANVTWQRRYGVTLRLAVGIHSGEAVVGNVGSERRMEYTAIGDTVNVAARLESIARPDQILVSAQTRDAAGPHFEYTDLGERTLSGRAEPVHVYEVRP